MKQFRLVSYTFSSFIKKMAENVAKDCKHIQRAARVQNNILNEIYSIEHEAKLRQKVDIETSIEGLEKEMRREIVQALKRSESKVKFFIEKALQKYSQHKRQPLRGKQIQNYNKLVKACETARWEYMVHRHSCGFTIRNYEIVTELYKLPPNIPQQKQLQK